VDLTALFDQVGRVVRLEFSNGEQIEAKLLAVDPQVHADLTYDVLRVLATGEPPAPGTATGTIVVASTDDLVSWEAVLR